MNAVFFILVKELLLLYKSSFTYCWI